VSEWTTGVIKEGIRLELVEKVEKNCVVELRMEEEKKRVIDKEIEELLKEEVIREVEEREVKFFSKMFAIPKPDGTNRVILDLRMLNKSLVSKKFKMENIQTVKELMTKECWFIKIDLKSAYHQIPIRREDQTYLSFHWKGKNYCYQVMPFGLSIAPRIFTKIMRPVVMKLREEGIKCVIYLDDILVLGESKEDLERKKKKVLDLLYSLGWMINQKKSMLEPVQEIEFLGLKLDSIKMSILVPNKKVREIKREIKRVLEKEVISIRNLASLIGKIQAINQAVFMVPFRTREMLLQKIQELKAGNWEKMIFLEEEVKMELRWWLENIKKVNGKEVETKEIEKTLTTDASLIGWGRYWRDKRRFKENGIRWKRGYT